MIQILLFAQLKETVGQAKLTIEEEAITISELKQRYLSQYGINDQLDEAMIAVNEEYAKADTTVHAGDTVAFIPPVSGG